MALASKLGHSQWFEVGQSAIVIVIFGQIWLFDHEKSHVELSDSYAILLSILNYIFRHIFKTVLQNPFAPKKRVRGVFRSRSCLMK